MSAMIWLVAFCLVLVTGGGGANFLDRSPFSIRPSLASVDDSIYPTDVQLVSLALRKSLEDALGELPLTPNARIFLQGQKESARDWIAEDILMEVLIRRGFKIVLKPPQAGKSEAGVLHYRLADPKVLYTPWKGKWFSVRSWIQREAYGNLFLRLHDSGGRILWTRRIEAHEMDRVPADRIELLGGGTAVTRTLSETGSRIIERGLSASIIGGLFYIFFVF